MSVTVLIVDPWQYCVRLVLFGIDWYCGAEVFGLIRCITLSLSLALPTFSNNNNNNNGRIIIYDINRNQKLFWRLQTIRLGNIIYFSIAKALASVYSDAF